MSQRFIIVGGGVAGLASALALRRAGYDALVLERRPALPDEGAGIQLGPNGVAALRRLGLEPAVAAVASRPRAIDVHDGASGTCRTRLPLGDWIAQRHGAPYLVAHRAALVEVLARSAADAGVRVVTSSAVVVVAQNHRGVSVRCHDGLSFDGEGVIVADGVWSALRPALFGPAHHPIAHRRMAARTLIDAPQDAVLPRDAVGVWLSAGAHLVTYPIGDGRRLNVVLIVPSEDDAAPRWSMPIDGAQMTAQLSRFAPRIRNALSTSRDWRAWPLVTVAPLPAYHQGRIAIVGDAAHAMLPFLAQGAVMALEDAEALARCLAAAQGQPAAAFVAYTHARLERTRKVVKAAERNGKLYHLGGPLAVMRNMALRTFAPHLVMRGYDWLYAGGSEMPAPQGLSAPRAKH